MTLTAYLLLIPGAFLAPVIHEFAKARIAGILGDPTPRNMGFTSGRLFKYFEPVGFIFMVAFRVGWGQPVPTNPLHYKNRRSGVLLVHGLPILINFFIGVAVLAFLRLEMSQLIWAHRVAMEGGAWAPPFIRHLHAVLFVFAQCNIYLALFSLLPVHPMGASKILPLFVRPELAMRLTHYEKPLQMLMIILLIFGVITGIFGSVFQQLLNVVLR